MVRTSASEKHAIDLQIARYLYATNSPFSVANHAEFKKMIQMLRPGYNPFNRMQVGGKLLDECFIELLFDCKALVQETSVSMSLDGWNNVHNEPILFDNFNI